MKDSVQQSRDKQDQELEDQRIAEDMFLEKEDDVLVEIKELIEKIQESAKIQDVREEFVEEILRDLI